MVNRKRQHRVTTWVDDEELALLQERMNASGVTNMGAYLRKMAIDGVHVNIDLSDVREFVSLLRRCCNNVNQIARKCNETHSIFKDDVSALQRGYASLWSGANELFERLGGLLSQRKT